MRTLVVLSLLAMATLAGCTTTSGPVTPEQDSEGRYVIEVGPSGRLAFSPADATVPVGATVLWSNVGGFHNVFSDDGKINSGQASAEDWEYEVTFTEAGTFTYYCEPHETSGMIGTLTVA